MAMTSELLAAARSAIGFMPEDEGLALHDLGRRAAQFGPLLEIGGYCGKSAIYLGAAARDAGTVLFSVDHHRGSEENQPGEQYHDPRLVDAGTGRIDTLPWFRRTVAEARLDDTVVAVVGASTTVARNWAAPLGMVFIDGGHSEAAAQADFDAWHGRIVEHGILAIHDVFPDPADGGRPPFNVYQRALAGGDFEEVLAVGSLRGLVRRTAGEL